MPTLEALVGSGVFYGAAASESRAMQGQDVFIVGAGNSAGQAALHLAKYARSVTLLVRGDSLAKSMSELSRARHRVDPERHRPSPHGGGRRRIGAGSLEHLTLADRANGTVEEVPAAALFVMIGGEPQPWLPAARPRDTDHA